jgi:alkanesulfonate monooxygenase SsuD/methylene tetrahydromethanopterin reductase-like flavin-dependent oxidoreductase (luciferase family)
MSLRTLIQGPRPVTAPLVLNPLMARMVEAAGFPAGYLGGGASGYAKVALEANLNLTEMCQAALDIRAVSALPLILDGPHVEFFAEHFPRIQAAARAAGRAPDAVVGAAYVTLALDADAVAAEQRLNTFLETYYAAPASALRARQATYAGPIEGGVAWLQRWIDAGCHHLMLRFAGGDQLAQVDEVASRLLPRLRR